MTRTLAGKTILVSGGSRGIGLADAAHAILTRGIFLPDAPLPERP